jgi:hypothetical protein
MLQQHLPPLNHVHAVDSLLEQKSSRAVSGPLLPGGPEFRAHCEQPQYAIGLIQVTECPVVPGSAFPMPVRCPMDARLLSAHFRGAREPLDDRLIHIASPDPHPQR